MAAGRAAQASGVIWRGGVSQWRCLARARCISLRHGEGGGCGESVKDLGQYGLLRVILAHDSGGAFLPGSSGLH